MGVSEGGIPTEKLPKCWSDDVRMNALFAPFRLKTANPESWNMKMKFWSDMMRVWCQCKNNPIISVADAKVAFQRKGRTPACIDIVIEESYRSNELSPITKYQQILHNGPEGWVRWGARLAFKPAALAFTAVSFLLPKKTLTDSDGLPKASIDSTQRFVLESAVEEQAMNLLENFPPGVERMGTIDQLMKRCWSGARDAFEVLLGYLVSRGLAVKKGDYVKLAETTTKVEPITESDEALVRLLQAEEKLTRDAERITREIDAITSDAKAALQLGNRLAAKNHLRRKHTLQGRVIKCENALENVRQLLQGMKEMEVNKAVVDTYKMSSQAMKRGMEEGGLSEDSVHDTMDDLKDVLETYNDIERALSAPVEDSNLEDLEEELRELMSGGGGSGGTPMKDNMNASLHLPSPPKSAKNRLPSEGEYIFDGEARMLAELNDLGMNEASPKEKRDIRGRKKIALADGEEWKPEAKKEPKQKSVKPWSPKPEVDEDLDRSLDELCSSFGELRTDQRLHPGQKLDIDYSSPSALYNNDFQIQDHTRDDHVWLYNTSDKRRDTMSGEQSDKRSGDSASSTQNPFQMAPGGERKPSAPWGGDSDLSGGLDDLQKRLDNLRKQ